MDPSIRMSGYNTADWLLYTRFVGEAQAAILSDGHEAPEHFQPVFEYLAQNLCEDGVRVSEAFADAGISGNYSGKFKAITGRLPKEYFDYHKSRLAQKILRHTNAQVGDVAASLGFDEHSCFTRWYERLFGNPPSKEASALTRDVPRITTGADEIEPGEDRSSPNLVSFWNRIRRSNYQTIKKFIYSCGNSIRIAHFHFLLHKAKYEGRANRERGVELTHAAMDALNMAEYWDFEDLSREKALGFASLSNAYRRAFDMDAAIKWSLIADKYLKFCSKEDVQVYCQSKIFKAYVLWWQRDEKASLNLAAEILPSVREKGASDLIVRVLLLQGEIYDSTGASEDAAVVLSEAVEFASTLDDSYLAFSTRFNLALVYARLLRRDDAVGLFGHVKESWVLVKNQVPKPYISYLGGLVCRLDRQLLDAETLFVESRAGFLEQNLYIFAALVSLDLALLYIDLKNFDDAYSLAVSAIPLISQYDAHPEAIAALTILQESEQIRKIRRIEVQKALSHLEAARKDPLLGRQISGRPNA